MLQSAQRSPRWHELQRSLAESFKPPAATSGSWLDRVRITGFGPKVKLPQN